MTVRFLPRSEPSAENFFKRRKSRRHRSEFRDSDNHDVRHLAVELLHDFPKAIHRRGIPIVVHIYKLRLDLLCLLIKKLYIRFPVEIRLLDLTDKIQNDLFEFMQKGYLFIISPTFLPSASKTISEPEARNMRPIS